MHCHICDKQFTRRWNLDRHIDLEHKTGVHDEDPSLEDSFSVPGTVNSEDGASELQPNRVGPAAGTTANP